MSIDNIKRIRKSKHITQQALADAINVDTSVISKYETGKISPSFDRLSQIADVLGVKIDYLLGDSIDELAHADRRRMIVTAVDEDCYVASSSILAEELLSQANGVCELCGAKMPLVRSGNSWFLEAHYIEWLSKGGHITPDNIAILCPTCHKYIHSVSYEESVALLKKAKAAR